MFRFLASLLGVAAACVPVASFAVEPGYYSVAERDGVSWFVDPQGYHFFSLGISDIGPGATREAYDAKRPAYAAFQHFESTEAWAADTLARVKLWNFNTLGSWVHPSLA